MSFIPNTTPTPNWLYNGEMKKMNETELKVVLLVTRKTLGWFDPATSQRKTQDYISQSQFMDFTGQGNKAISTAIQSSVEHGWIIARDKVGSLCETPKKRARRKVWYQLGSIFTGKLSGVLSTPDESGVQKSTHLVYKRHQSGVESTQYKRNYTKEILTKLAFSEKREEQAEPAYEAVPDPNLFTPAQLRAYEAKHGSRYSTRKTIAPAEQIDATIRAFSFNPDYKNWFRRDNQRGASDRLIGIHGLEKLLQIIAILPKTNLLPYMTGIHSPIELEAKWSAFEANMFKMKSKHNQEKEKYKVAFS